MFDRKDFGNRMKEIRQESGLTAKKFEEKATIRISTFYSYERERSLPNIETVDVLCNIFNLNVLWFITGEGPKEKEVVNGC